MTQYVIALDQGTTSSRTIAFDDLGRPSATARRPIQQIYPQPGWVEHDPMEILNTQLETLREVTEAIPGSAAAIGVTNQRETTIVWDRHTGQPVYHAIVWQCRRTADECAALQSEPIASYIADITGLRLDAYFSATKIKWILDHVPGAREQAEAGDLLFGTVESWLIWNLTGGRAHVTDVSNASRTMLFDIHRLQWDLKICEFFGIPASMLPKPVGNSEVYGVVDGEACGIPALDGVPVCGSAGDQQAALFGQCCFTRGETKNTYGTGCFTLMNTGSEPTVSSHGLLPTVAWSIGGRKTYALEGSVFNGGSTIQWLRDELGIIRESRECDVLADQVTDTGGVYVVPAFTGLGAPYWDSYARGTIIGITRGTDRRHICRAVLEGIAYQVYDLLRAMEADTGVSLQELKVDGGACVSDIMMQFQADLLKTPVARPESIETTALGAAYLAGLSAGVWGSIDELRSLNPTEHIFTPGEESSSQTDDLLRQWHRAVERSARWIEVQES